MAKKLPLHKMVFIEESLKDVVSPPPDMHANVFYTPNIIEDIIRFTRKTDKRLYILIFAPLDKTGSIQRELNNLDSRELSYSIAAYNNNGEDTAFPEDLRLEEILTIRTSPISPGEFAFLSHKSSQLLAQMNTLKEIQQDYIFSLEDVKNDQDALVQIGRYLSIEKNPDKLFRIILSLSKKITGADAGSIFLTEIAEDDEKWLRIKYAHTFSREFPFEEFTIPYDTQSIAGYVAETGEVLNIPDVYHLKDDVHYSFNKGFDQSTGYRCKSMLVVPMRNHNDAIIGVIQLINSKESTIPTGEYTGNEAYEILLKEPDDFEKMVVPFHPKYEDLMTAIANQAAITLENAQMIKQIENQFEEFVKASVTAIESRDPATSGHSFRVSQMCVNALEAISRQTEGPFKDLTFSDNQVREIRFAGLLHDFGKVYVEPSIFLKAKKLFDKDFENLILRLSLIYRSIEIEGCLKGTDPRDVLDMLETVISQVRTLNEPAVRKGDKKPVQVIEDIKKKTRSISAEDLAGNILPILTDEEVKNLEVERGSLNPEERLVIESHVKHTLTFVSKIPWPEELKQIPEIAGMHHEKLDGTGYPFGKKGDEIPIQAQIMAIADIYDALSASDRPYKKAVPFEKVCAILRDEGERGKANPDLVELFITEKVYELEEEEDAQVS